MLDFMHHQVRPKNSYCCLLFLFIGNADISFSSELKLNVTAYHPRVEATINCKTSNHPPTHQFWNKDDQNITNITDCGYSSYQIITDRHDSDYSNILNIVAVKGCQYTGTYSCNVMVEGLNGNSLETKLVEIGKFHEWHPNFVIKF